MCSVAAVSTEPGGAGEACWNPCAVRVVDCALAEVVVHFAVLPSAADRFATVAAVKLPAEVTELGVCPVAFVAVGVLPVFSP